MSAAVLDATHAEILLTPAETADALGITLDDLDLARQAGTAPTYVELGARTVRYFRAAVCKVVSER